ncbi:hypothetical protein Y032_0034g2824 [Ancylostoma ceylanicum]|uniref:Uncharacterized protein n=1 Tax=Ancylostoma ceylanicum TaxID=53326 RepID=A0A016ULU5_9BILA|nr:hypothetical protein Y032_0034g2824 [Ancylostoma ceylanicum]
MLACRIGQLHGIHHYISSWARPVEFLKRLAPGFANFKLKFHGVRLCLNLILPNGVLEQLSENAGPLLQAGRAAHVPQALRARKLFTDCS